MFTPAVLWSIRKRSGSSATAKRNGAGVANIPGEPMCPSLRKASAVLKHSARSWRPRLLDWF